MKIKTNSQASRSKRKNGVRTPGKKGLGFGQIDVKSASLISTATPNMMTPEDTFIRSKELPL
ncbi:hypothetical protein [Cyclobacterium sp.]|uniref:hypothetical protein n=1 Tax=Cyclobacterium sp. TaxID=1966343 RepID=UPI00198C9798|nr:hypothetical protein [Cyclobacterium sp.]MBD3630266.1 hypothetical protein [Cyclobacterium sp.]